MAYAFRKGTAEAATQETTEVSKGFLGQQGRKTSGKENRIGNFFKQLATNISNIGKNQIIFGSLAGPNTIRNLALATLTLGAITATGGLALLAIPTIPALTALAMTGGVAFGTGLTGIGIGATLLSVAAGAIETGKQMVQKAFTRR